MLCRLLFAGMYGEVKRVSKVLIIGAGRQARAIAYILGKQDCVDQIACWDRSYEALERITKEIPENKLAENFYEDDINSAQDIEEILSQHDLVVSSLSYDLNVMLARAAIRTKTHMVDLGGNNDIVRRQLQLHNYADDAGILIVPDCGLAPGMANLLAAHGINQLDGADSVTIRVGGLPINPQPPLNYQLVFNISGLINEYINPCKVIRDGEVQEVDPLIDLEYLELNFDTAIKKNADGLVDVEAFNTSGGLSTLIESFEGSVKNMDYKTIRYLGHAHIVRAIKDLGFFDEEKLPSLSFSSSPRNGTETILNAAKSINQEGSDLVLVRIYIKNKGKGLTYQITDYYSEKTDHSAMMRCTGYPTAVIASMILDGTIKSRGVLPGEKCVPLDEFIDRVEKTGIVIGRGAA